MLVRLENQSDGHSKFYELAVHVPVQVPVQTDSREEYETRATWGRIGNEGQSQSKCRGSWHNCRQTMNELLREKQGHGYAVVSGDDEFMRQHPALFPGRAMPPRVASALAGANLTPARPKARPAPPRVTESPAVSQAPATLGDGVQMGVAVRVRKSI